MKHKIALLFLSLAGSLSLFAQTASVNEGCTPLEVSFTAPAGATAFFWDFQNGATSTLPNPENTYATPGIYEVTFSEGQGQPVIGTVTITVYPKPEPAILFDPANGCTPLPVAFTDNSTVPEGITITNYEWVFGDGTTATGTPAPTHIYTTAGTFDVSLALETNLASCNVTQIFEDVVTTSSPANVFFNTSPSPPFACDPPLLVGFSNQSSGGGPGLTFTWDFGNGNTFTGPNPPAQTYDAEGSYTVTLTASDDNGCEVSFSRTVRIGPPRARFIIPDTVCVGDSIRITNISDPGAYSWTFGPGASPETSNEPQPVVVFSEEGSYDITLSVNSPLGCDGDTTITIYADQADASFVSDPGYSCEEPVTFTYTPLSGEASEFLWIFSDGSTSTEENPSRVYENTDTTTYSMNGQILDPVFLIATNPSGCRDTFFQPDTIFVPNARFMPDRLDGCAPLTVTFSDSSKTREPIVTWEWDLGDGTVITQTEEEPLIHTFTEPGEYPVQLTITNEAGCTDTSYVVVIRVGELLPLDVIVDQSEICPGDTVSFMGIGDTTLIDAWHIETEDGRSFHCFQDDEPSWTIGAVTGPLDVSITAEYNGCLSSTIKENFITVKGPIARIDYEIDCEAPFDVTFRDSSFEATSLLWDFGDGETATTTGEFIHTYAGTGDYWVTLTAENANTGCPPSVDSMLVCVREIKAEFEIDDKVCRNLDYKLDASASQDVDADCWKGYNWFFEISNRPITTQDSIIDFVFPFDGDEIITLVVEDINGCTDTLVRETRVFGVDPDFTFDDDLICFPATVSFTDLSTADTTLVSWEWSFGATDPNPTVTLNEPVAPGDSLQVTLNVEDAIGCPGMAVDYIRVYAPTSTIVTDPGPPFLCTGDELSFFATDFTEGGSNLTFNWDFDNGDGADTQAASTSYTQGGSYNVVLSFTEVGSGCSGQTAAFVSVEDYPEAAFLSSVDDEPVICYPEQITFFDASISEVPLNYFWDFGNGQTGAGAAPTASFGKGTFTVEMIASTPNGCRDTTSRSFTLIGPEGTFTIEPGVGCLGDEFTFTLQDTVDVGSFTWNFGDGTEADDINPVGHTYTFLPPTGQTVATLVLRGADEACAFAVERPVNIFKVTADFIRQDGIDTTLCLGLEYLFQNTSTGADLYQWNFGNGQSSTQTDPGIIYEEAGTYTVQLIAEDAQLGCTDTVQKVVIIDPLPTFEVPGDSICRGDSITLRVSNPPPGAIYAWSSTDDPDFMATDEARPLIKPMVIGRIAYQVTITDQEGCEGSGEGIVIVDPCVAFDMPNAFTPNNDGQNDFFNFVTNGIYPEEYSVLSFKVFNRWGQVVYDNDSPDQGWDGMHNGNEAPSDVYVYIVELEINNDRKDKVMFKGEVTLLR